MNGRTHAGCNRAARLGRLLIFNVALADSVTYSVCGEWVVKEECVI